MTEENIEQKETQKKFVLYDGRTGDKIFFGRNERGREIYSGSDLVKVIGRHAENLDTLKRYIMANGTRIEQRYFKIDDHHGSDKHLELLRKANFDHLVEEEGTRVHEVRLRVVNQAIYTLGVKFKDPMGHDRSYEGDISCELFGEYWEETHSEIIKFRRRETLPARNAAREDDDIQLTPDHWLDLDLFQNVPVILAEYTRGFDVRRFYWRERGSGTPYFGESVSQGHWDIGQRFNNRDLATLIKR